MQKIESEERIKKIKKRITAIEEEKTEVLKRKGKAGQMGDIHENAAFESARHKIWILDAQIASLKEEIEEIRMRRKM